MPNKEPQSSKTIHPTLFTPALLTVTWDSILSCPTPSHFSTPIHCFHERFFSPYIFLHPYLLPLSCQGNPPPLSMSLPNPNVSFPQGGHGCPQNPVFFSILQLRHPQQTQSIKTIITRNTVNLLCLCQTAVAKGIRNCRYLKKCSGQKEFSHDFRHLQGKRATEQEFLDHSFGFRYLKSAQALFQGLSLCLDLALRL